MADNYIPKNKKKVVRKSALPFYCAAAAYFVFFLLFPLTLLSFIFAVLVTLIVFVIAEKKAPASEEYIEKTDKELTTGDSETDQLLKQGRADIKTLTDYGSKVSGEDIKQKLYRITVTGDKILDYVNDNPKSASKVRQFLHYFLPTTKKLMDNYMMLVDQQASGENIDATKAKIEQMLGQIADAFDKQLDALFADTAVDVNADISVMQNLLNEKGLTDQDDVQQVAEGKDIQLQL